MCGHGGGGPGRNGELKGQILGSKLTERTFLQVSNYIYLEFFLWRFEAVNSRNLYPWCLFLFLTSCLAQQSESKLETPAHGCCPPLLRCSSVCAHPGTLPSFPACHSALPSFQLPPCPKLVSQQEHPNGSSKTFPGYVSNACFMPVLCTELGWWGAQQRLRRGFLPRVFMDHNA